MKTTGTILNLFAVLAAYTATAAAAAAAAATTGNGGDCGDLGALELPSSFAWPAGADPAGEVRQCDEHPLVAHSQRDGPEDGLGGSLARRSCYWGADVGCDKGYCWKRCDGNGGGNTETGQWCWTASNGGLGAWKECKYASDCSKDEACGIGGDKCEKSCGCSC